MQLKRPILDLRIFGQVDISSIMTRVIVEFNYLASLSQEIFINFSFCKWYLTRRKLWILRSL